MIFDCVFVKNTSYNNALTSTDFEPQVSTMEVLSTPKAGVPSSTKVLSTPEVSLTAKVLSPQDTEGCTPKTVVEVPSTTIPKPKTLSLHRLSDVEIRKMKIYSGAEIENARGIEKQYRRFWNEQKLAKDRSMSKSMIYKQVNERWKLKICLSSGS